MPRNIVFSPEADSDIVEVLEWSLENFGIAAADRYQNLLETAFKDIAEDPERLGVKDRAEVLPELRSWHLRMSRDRVSFAGSEKVMRPRHVIYFRFDDDAVTVSRILHEVRDPMLHFA
jgi:toxin ParE1/3/4